MIFYSSLSQVDVDSGIETMDVDELEMRAESKRKRVNFNGLLSCLKTSSLLLQQRPYCLQLLALVPVRKYLDTDNFWKMIILYPSVNLKIVIFNVY